MSTPSDVPRVTPTTVGPAVIAWMITDVLARVLVAMVLALLAWASVPAVFGWIPTTVVSGSMEPRIVAGDVVVAMPVGASELVEGRVVLADRPGHEGERLLHRIHEVTAGGSIVTKGDANDSADRTSLRPRDVHGVGVLRVPFVGAPVVWLRDGAMAELGGAALVVLALVVVLSVSGGRLRAVERRGPNADGRESSGADDDRAGVDARGDVERDVVRTDRRGVRRARVLVPIAVGLVGAAVGGLIAAGGTTAAYSSTSSARGAWSASDRYSCFRSGDEADLLSWGFDEASGTVLEDSSGNGMHGVMNSKGGNVVRSDSGCVGNPFLSMPGYGHVHTRAAAAGPSVFTIEAWIRTSRPQGKVIGFGNLPTNYSTLNDRHLYVTARGAIAFGTHDQGGRGPVSIASTTTVADGGWHHVAATLSGDGMRLYVDGVLEAADPNTASSAYSGFWRLGYDRLDPVWVDTPASSIYIGDIDSVGVHTAALSAVEIAERAGRGR